MSQWIIPIGSVGSREAGSTPNFSLKLASFLTEGRQLAGALFFVYPGQGYKHLPKIALFIRRRLRSIACLAGSEDRAEGALFRAGALRSGSISKGIIESKVLGGQEYSVLFSKPFSSLNWAGESTNSIFSPRFTSPYPHYGGVFFFRPGINPAKGQPAFLPGEVPLRGREPGRLRVRAPGRRGP